MPSGYGTTQTKYFALGGGLDVTSPALAVDPGRLLAAVNYEPWFEGGYRRIDGYERFDGRAKPSEATFTGFDVNATTGLSVGTAVTGGTSGATGIVIGISGLSIGVTKVTGTFALNETLTGGGSRTITSTPGLREAPDADTEDAWLLEAQDEYRADIGRVPGVGDVNGIWQRDENVYAVRDNHDSGGHGLLYLASASGWTQNGVIMAKYIYFSGGGGGTAQALPVEGATINGQSSSATGVVHRIVTHSGSTVNNDAAGYIVLISVVGTFTNAENLRVGATKFATAAGGSISFTFAPGGKYRFVNHNFFGSSSSFRTYGVNGVGPAFEIDEDNIVSPILLPRNPITDQPDDNLPFLIEEHLNYLFLAFPGGRFVQSVVGEPLVFSGFLGAADFGVGDEVTGLHSITGGVLAIVTEQETHGLFGTGIDDWEMKLIAEKSGGKLYGSQKLDTVYALNNLGVSSLARTQVFGNFVGSTVSQQIQPIVTALRQQIADSTIVRGSNQFRMYFNEGDVLIMYVTALGQENKLVNSDLPAQFGYAQYPNPVRVICNSEDEDGLEVGYFASDNGFVYQDRIGTSFDGDEIPSYIRLPFNHCGTPALRKKFRRADLEIQSGRPLTLKFIQDLTYGSLESDSDVGDLTTSDVPVIDIFAGGGFFDTDNFDQFYWDGQNISTARADLNGTGENIGFLIFNESAIAQPFVIQGITLHFDKRRLQR
jgi:hypothetical protein